MSLWRPPSSAAIAADHDAPLNRRTLHTAGRITTKGGDEHAGAKRRYPLSGSHSSLANPFGRRGKWHRRLPQKRNADAPFSFSEICLTPIRLQVSRL